MVGGWKFMEKKEIEAEEVSGISPYPTAKPTAPATAPRPAKSG